MAETSGAAEVKCENPSAVASKDRGEVQQRKEGKQGSSRGRGGNRGARRPYKKQQEDRNRAERTAGEGSAVSGESGGEERGSRPAHPRQKEQRGQNGGVQETGHDYHRAQQTHRGKRSYKKPRSVGHSDGEKSRQHVDDVDADEHRQRLQQQHQHPHPPHKQTRNKSNNEHLHRRHAPHPPRQVSADEHEEAHSAADVGKWRDHPPNPKVRQRRPADHRKGQGRRERSSERPGDRTNQGEHSNKAHSKGNNAQQRRAKKSLFPPLGDVKSAEIQEGIKEGRLYCGNLHVNRFRRELAYVTVPEFTDDILIEGMSDRNRTFHGDDVVVRLYPKEKWPRKEVAEEKEVDQEEENEADDIEELDQESTEREEHSLVAEMEKLSVSKEEISETTHRPIGFIVGIVEHLHVTNVAGYLKSRSKQGKIGAKDTQASFVPLDARLPMMVAFIDRLQPPAAEKNDDDTEADEKKGEKERKENAEAQKKPSDVEQKMQKDGNKEEETEGKGEWTLPVRSHEEWNENLFMAKISAWKDSQRLPTAKLVKNLGKIGSDECAVRAVAAEYEAQGMLDFSDTITKHTAAVIEKNQRKTGEATTEPVVKLTQKEKETRRDLSDELIITIDPLTAKDLDDAVSCKKVDGGYEVGVHIADASHYVPMGSVLDKEAGKRATTVYLAWTNIPMLPRELSENLCSLMPDVPRRTFSVIFKLNEKGEIMEEPWFGKSQIKTAAKIDYDSAQAVIEGHSLPDSVEVSGRFTRQAVEQSILMLNGMARHMRHTRFTTGGSLSLDNIKVYFIVDPDTGKPIGVKPYRQKEANNLIEEFMLLANKAVGKKILTTYPSGALLRRHPAPGERKLSDMRSWAAKVGLKVDPTTAATLNRSLKEYEDDFVALLSLRAMTTKPMNLAKYTQTSAEDNPQEAYHHYGLNFITYTHFTSPIRRYADLVVHRILAASLAQMPAPYTEDELSRIAHTCNNKKLMADRAQDDSDEVFLCQYVNGLPGKKLLNMHAVVLEVFKTGVEICVPELAWESRLIFSNFESCKPDANNVSLELIVREKAKKKERRGKKEGDKDDVELKDTEQEGQSSQQKEKGGEVEKVTIAVFDPLLVDVFVKEMRKSPVLDCTVVLSSLLALKDIDRSAAARRERGRELKERVFPSQKPEEGLQDSLSERDPQLRM